jgi:hypothetical protein
MRASFKNSVRVPRQNGEGGTFEALERTKSAIDATRCSASTTRADAW